MKINLMKKGKFRFIKYRPDLYNDYTALGGGNSLLKQVPDVNSITYKDQKYKGSKLPIVVQGTYEFRCGKRTIYASVLGVYKEYDVKDNYAIWTYLNKRGTSYSSHRCINMRQENNVIMRQIRIAHENKDRKKVGKLISSILEGAVKENVLVFLK